MQSKYYFPGLARKIRAWVTSCQDCIANKRIDTRQIRPKMLSNTEFTMGPEDCLEVDILPNLPSSNGYQHIITMMDVFSRYLFAYPTQDMTAKTVARCIIDVMTRHCYLPTVILTDEGSQFRSEVVNQIAQTLDIRINHASTKHAQTIGILERTHASLKTSLKISTGERRSMWHKYVQIAVMNYNTSYHESLGCEPTTVFHGRIPYNILDIKLGLKPNWEKDSNEELTDQLQKQIAEIHQAAKVNLMQSYLKYKQYYDKKATATPLKVNDYCYVLNPKADNQSMKFAFKDCIWTGPYTVVKVLSNINYVVRRTGTRYTQTLQRIRLRLYAPNQRVPDVTVRREDTFQIQRLKQPTMIGTRKLGKPNSEKFCSEIPPKTPPKKLQLQKSQTQQATPTAQRKMKWLKQPQTKLQRKMMWLKQPQAKLQWKMKWFKQPRMETLKEIEHPPTTLRHLI